MFLQGCVRQREYYEELVEDGDSMQHFELMILVFFYLIACLCPARGLEYRLLEILEERPAASYSGNGVYPWEGTFILRTALFKNRKFVGVTEHKFPSSYPDLITFYRKYISKSRKKLLKGEHHSYVFVNSNGHPFRSSGGFTKFQNRIFLKRLEISKVATNALRIGFVEWFLEEVKGEDREQVLDSLASTMRHTRRAQKTYDKRTSIEKKQKGIAYASELLAKFSAAESEDSTPESEHENAEPADAPVVGSLVASCSTTQKPFLVWFGLIERVRQSEVKGKWLKKTTGNRYVVTEEALEEHVDSLVWPIQSRFCSKKQEYQIITTLTSIRKQFV